MVNIITKRHKAPGMIVPHNESESNIVDEVNRRTCKAGYTDRDGQPKVSRSNSVGKGDVPRPVNKKLYDQNYERIFGHK